MVLFTRLVFLMIFDSVLEVKEVDTIEFWNGCFSCF
jgi:hypothetical protein